MKEFIRGQKAKLADLTPQTAIEVGVQVGFQTPQDADISCFGVDENNQLSDDRYFVFYNQKQSPEGAVRMLGPQGGDTERFAVDLSRLPPAIRRLLFVTTLDPDQAGTMARVTQGHLQVLANGQPVAVFRFAGADFAQEKAIIIAEIYFKEVWRFGAVGQGFEGGLSALLKQFGGEEVAPAPQPAPAPPPPPSPSAPPPAAAAPPPPPPPPPSAPAAPSVSLNKVTLEKKGEKQAVSLKKGGGFQPIHINLNWEDPSKGQKKGFWGLVGGGGGGPAPDLDLGCMFRLADGRGSVIQPLGKRFGAKDEPPYIYLDKDDRSGAAADGENLYIFRPDLIDLVMIFALIYEGAKDFTSVNGRMTIRDQSTGQEIFMRLNNPDPDLSFCAVCTIRRVGDQVEITKEERYFSDHSYADKHFGFGFRWTAGRK